MMDQELIWCLMVLAVLVIVGSGNILVSQFQTLIMTTMTTQQTVMTALFEMCKTSHARNGTSHVCPNYQSWNCIVLMCPINTSRLLKPNKYSMLYLVRVGWDSVVSIATRYELDGPGIESRWGWDFQHPSRLALGPTQPLVQWVPGHSRG